MICDDLKNTATPSIYLRYYDSLDSKGQLSRQFSSWWVKDALASGGPNGDSIATLSICLYNILLNANYDSLVAQDRKFLN